MPTYQPGSFTKNFGWNLNPPGLRALYDAIRAGFGSRLGSLVLRDSFRARSGIVDTNRQLIPLNFFLHNTILHGENYITEDELVRHATATAHSRRFDYLALFALNLARMGKRAGVAGTAIGAGFANEYVKNDLWDYGGWQRSKLTESVVENSFSRTIIATGADTVHKCVTNYLFIHEMVGFRAQSTAVLNARTEEWIGPALFLAFDRFTVDDFGGLLPTQSDLITIANKEELHKLLGTTKAFFDAALPVFADQYVGVGGLKRPIATPTVAASAASALARTPTAVPVARPDTPAAASSTSSTGTRGGTSTPTPPPLWTDEEAEETATVVRRLQEIQTQVRNPQHVRELKQLYEHNCAFCGKATIVGVAPLKHYSEVAHIKPVGDPHKGPDSKANMLVLCPEHHIQLDRGVLTLSLLSGSLIISSKIKGDPLHGVAVTLKAPHTIADEFVKWHRLFWA